MNPRQFLATFALCAMLSACDLSSTTQAGTSSETQTALQELADNLRTNPKLAKGIAQPPFAGRHLDVPGDCLGQEGQWIQSGYWQQEMLPPTNDDHSSELNGAHWLSRRVGLATDRNGRLKSCGEGGYFQVQWHQEISSIDGDHRWGAGIASGVDPIRGIDRFEYSLTVTGSTGFQLIRHEIDTTPQPEGPWFNWMKFAVLESELLFGNGRYRIPDLAAIHDTTRLPGFQCAAIQDLAIGARAIGFYCWANRPQHDSIVILDANGFKVPANLLTSRSAPDSMGLSLLSAAIKSDSLRLSLRVQVPSAPGFSKALTRLCLGCSSSGASQAIPLYLEISSRLAELGAHLDWGIPVSALDSSHATISILRRYPDWLTQMSNSSDSLSGWSIVSQIQIAGPDLAASTGR